MTVLLEGFAIGVGGTLVMDCWAFVLAPLVGQNRPNWAMPGRWLGHVFRGKLFHDDIGRAEPIASERLLGWLFHYDVGIIYGLFWAWFAGPEWLDMPTFFPVWIFSLLTLSAGWFLLHPGMGMGWFASKTAAPWTVRGMGVIAHSFFALGLFATAMIL